MIWVEIKYLHAIKNRSWQLFCRGGNAFPQHTLLAYASAIATCRHELERLGSEVFFFFQILETEKKKRWLASTIQQTRHMPV